MPPPLVFCAVEVSAFPARAAGHDHRQAPALERTGRVGTVDEVEPQLDQVGAADGVTPRPDLGHRPARHDCTQLRIGHKKKKAPSALG